MADEQNYTEQELLDILAGNSATDQRLVAFEVGDRRLESAIPYLVQLIQSASLGVQEAAEQGLRKIRGPLTVQAIVPMLRCEDVTLRNIAMDILREICIDDLPTLTWLLLDDDVDIRIFVADILASSHSPHALTPLCEALLHDPEVNVRYQAAVSLGELGFPEAAESLRLATQDDEWVQFAVMEALAKIKAESCVDILLQALETSSALVTSTVLDALGEIGHVKAAPMLLGYLDKMSGPLRTKTVKAIINLLGPSSLSLLGQKQLNSLRIYTIEGLKENDEESLPLLLSGLAAIGDEESSEAILNLMEELDPISQEDLFHQGAQALVAIGFNEAVEKALFSSSEKIRHITLEVCGAIEKRLGIYALKKHFEGFDAMGKQVAIELIALKGDDRDIPFFLERIQDSKDPHVLFHTLRFLGQNMQHVASAVDMISLLEHSSDMVKEAALEACLALNDEQTFKLLTDKYRSSDPVVRKMAIYTMGYTNAQNFVSELKEAIVDVDDEVRKVALEAIGYGWPISEEKLHILSHCLHDTNRDVRILATELLGHTGVEGMVLPLLEALQDEDDWVKVRAVEALGYNKIDIAAQAMVESFENASVLVKLKIIEALSVIRGDIAFCSLLSYMNHSNQEVQEAAIKAVAQLRKEDEAKHDR